MSPEISSIHGHRLGAGARFAGSVALRHLRFNVGQTLLTTAVVAISVTLIVFLNSIIAGVQARLITSVTGAIPHVTIRQPQRLPIAAWERPPGGAATRPADAGAESDSPGPPGTVFVGERIKLETRKRKIEDWAAWLPTLQSADPRITAVSPVVEGQGFLTRGAQRRAVTVTGVFPERHNEVVDVQSKLTHGRFFGLNAGEAAVGYKVADDLSLRLGDKVRLITSDGNAATYTIAGIFETGFFQVDTGTVFVTLRDAQTLYGLGTAVTSIGVKLDAIFAADVVADALATRLPYETNSWMRDYQSMLTGLKAQTATSSLILAFTTLASGFAIASILIMSVVSKIREIGILKAMGASRRQILSVFTLEGTLLALLGGTLGAATGSALSFGFSQIELTLGATGRPVKLFPLGLTPPMVVTAVLIAVAVGLVASLYPAWRASRVNPIEVIRGV